jgi:hypothetical protein
MKAESRKVEQVIEKTRPLFVPSKFRAFVVEDVDLVVHNWKQRRLEETLYHEKTKLARR